jgi:pilus assembly protein CpaB
VNARRRRGLLLLSVALASGGLAASHVHEREQSVAAQVGPRVPVLVAARDLPAGVRVRAGAVAVRRMPARYVPPDALASGVVGARPAVRVGAGSYLTAGVLARSNSEHRGGGVVGRGERAVTVAVSGAAGLVVGSRVDVLVSTESATGGGRTLVALAGARLLRLEAGGEGAAVGAGGAAGLDGGAAGGGTGGAGGAGGLGASGATALATLRVSLRQAVYLTAADNFAREIRLLARPPGDHSRAGAAVSQGQL